MKPVWKWILGIVIALLVLAALIGAPFLYRAVYGNAFSAMPGWRMHSPFGGWEQPRMPSFLPFGGMFLMGVFRLGWIVLLGLGIYWLVRSLTAPRLPARVCASCGRPLQADWTHCPHCGAKV